MNLPTRFLRFFFHHLYHGLAFSYDLVAAAVSFGHWNEWTRAVLPYLSGPRLLELGHGPGHLHLAIASERTAKSPDFAERQETFDSGPRIVFGLDESHQMGRLARARLGRAGKPVRLTRGVAQSLPFPSATFDCIVSTFPSNYIYKESTLAEAFRVLREGGRLIVLPVAWPKNRFPKWLFKVTMESPEEARESSRLHWIQPFVGAGFETEARILEVQSGTLLIVVATKNQR